MSKLQFNSGIKTYEIEEESTGELLCVLKVNTTDINMMNKLAELGVKVQSIIPGGDIESIEQIVEADKKIKELIDDAFNENISEKLFRGMNCISPDSNDGKTLVERFIDMISPVIASDFEEAVKKSNERISKYTDQVM